MLETYQEMKKRHQEEFNSFPIKFAFSNEQLKKGMEELGLKENETDKVVSIGAGGFMRKTDIEAYKELGKRHNKELEEAIKNDKTGENFIKDMFSYELSNHEYGYTQDVTETLEALGITDKDLEENQNLRNGLELAKEEITKAEEQEDEEEM